MAGFSSPGAGVDLLAPGYNILSAHLDGSLAVMSGTSQAAPFVAGAAVLALQAHPSWTPAQVRDFLVQQATPDAITGLPSGTPNRLLYTGWSRDATAPAPGTGAPSAPNTPPAGGMPTPAPSSSARPPATFTVSPAPRLAVLPVVPGGQQRPLQRHQRRHPRRLHAHQGGPGQEGQGAHHRHPPGLHHPGGNQCAECHHPALNAPPAAPAAPGTVGAAWHPDRRGSSGVADG